MTDFQQLTIDEVGQATVVRFRQPRLSGILELEKLGQELDELAGREDRGKLVLDFSSVQFLSSQTLGKLVALNRRVKARGGDMRLANVPQRVRSVMQTCKLDSLFDIQPDVAEALRSL
ncbi:MAG: STAS domain-containing protein [Thermoguttaceae bacterium]|jgi:anti-anti-sigma factor